MRFLCPMIRRVLSHAGVHTYDIAMHTCMALSQYLVPSTLTCDSQENTIGDAAVPDEGERHNSTVSDPNVHRKIGFFLQRPQQQQ